MREQAARGVKLKRQHGTGLTAQTELEKMFRQNSKYTLAWGAYFWQNKFVSDVGAPLEMF